MLSRPTPAPARVTHAGKERRSTLRLRCSGSAEFRVEGSEVRIWGTLYDVSLHGCYIEMNNTFPVDTRVNLVLEAMGIRVQMLAVVRVSYPFLGMGLCFSEIDPGQQLQLEQMLAAVSASATTSSPDPSLSPTATSTRSLADVEPGRPARQTQRVLLRQCPALAAGVLRVRQAIASLTFPLRSKLSGRGSYAHLRPSPPSLPASAHPGVRQGFCHCLVDWRQRHTNRERDREHRATYHRVQHGVSTQVTVVTLCNKFVGTNETFCGDQRTRFPLNDFVLATFMPGQPRSSLFSMHITVIKEMEVTAVISPEFHDPSRLRYHPLS